MQNMQNNMQNMQNNMQNNNAEFKLGRHDVLQNI